MIKIPKLLRALITFSGHTPYTFDWPRANEPPKIRLDLASGNLGTLRFGDHIDAAKPFGRPDDYRHQGRGCSLSYFKQGLHLEFDSRRRLSFVTFYLSLCPVGTAPFMGSPVHFSNGSVVSSESSPDDLSRLFGAATEATKDDEGMMLTHSAHGFLLDVHFTRDGRIHEIDIFKEDR